MVRVREGGHPSLIIQDDSVSKHCRLLMLLLLIYESTSQRNDPINGREGVNTMDGTEKGATTSSLAS